MRKAIFIFSLAAMFAAGSWQSAQAQTPIPDYRDMVTFGRYLQQHRQTYSAYAKEKTDLLKLSDSRDPAQINAEFQSKLNAITSAYQQIYQGKVAMFNAGVGVGVSVLGAQWQELGGLAGGVASDIFEGAAKKSAERKAAEERALLTIEFEDKFFTLKEEVLIEKRKLVDFYLMAAAFQLSEAEEKKYLDLANYLDCECQYIEDNFSMASVSWLTSNCPRPATTKYATSAAPKEPTVDVLLATIERKLSIPNIHFIRAARDFADIGMAKFPKNQDFLFYRIYLSEDNDEFDLMLIDELLKLDPKNERTLTLKKYYGQPASSYAEDFNNVKKLSVEVGVAGNPKSIIVKDMYIKGGYVYPIMRNGKMIYVLPNGEQAFNGEYDFGTVFDNGYARVKKNDLWGLIDQSGNIVIPCVYAELASSMNNHWRYYKRHYPNVFSSVDKYGYVTVRKITDKFGILSVNGKWIIEPKEILCPVVLSKDRFFKRADYRHSYQGFLYDVNGNKISENAVIPFSISNIQTVDDWFKCAVDKGWSRHWTFMDIDGNYVWGKDVVFDEIIDDNFTNGKCKVRKGKDTFYIDKTGKRID